MSRLTSIKLTDICRPKQWKTISVKEFTPTGYQVYGANGVIGLYSEYNHAEPTLMITCRGATCGSINLSEPFSYITGNAMALDNLDTEIIDIKFLYYYLKWQGFNNFISGTAQPQITYQSLCNYVLNIPPLEEQKRIAHILDLAAGLQAKRRQAIAQLDALLQSTFLEMFGDPVTNPKGWEVKELSELGLIVTGNTPSREKPEFYGNYIEWIKSDNINTPFHYLTKAKEFLSEEGRKIARTAPENSILVTCIAGSHDCIGNAAIAKYEVSFNQQINAFIPRDRENVFFWYIHFLVGKKLIQNASTQSMKGMVSKSAFSSVKFVVPPEQLRQSFSKKAQKIIVLIDSYSKSQSQLDTLFASLQQRAFTGRL